MKLAFRVFRSEGFSDLQVEDTAAKAAEFAGTIGREKLVSISHAIDGHIHIVTVWFWSDG
jgi:hypothetical protein